MSALGPNPEETAKFALPPPRPVAPPAYVNGGGGGDHTPAAVGLWRQRGIILLCAALAAGTALVVDLFAPRRYAARVSVIAEPKKDSNPLALELRSQQERAAFLETQKELAVSRSVISATIGSLRTKAPESVTPEEVDDFLRNVTVASRSGLGTNPFAGGLGESNTFFIQVEASSPEEAARAANAMLDQFLAVTKRVRADQAQGAVAVLEAAVADGGKRVAAEQKKMAEFEAKAGPLVRDLIDYDKPNLPLFPGSIRTREDFDREQAEIERIRGNVKALNTAAQGTGMPVISSGVAGGDVAIIAIKQKLADLRSEVTRQSALYNENSREMRNLKSQEAQLTDLFREEIKASAVREQQVLDGMEAAQASRKKTLANYGQSVADLANLNVEYAQVKARATATAKAQEKLAENMAGAQVAAIDRASQGGNIAVVDKAVPDSRPVSPRTTRDVALAALVGAAIGFLIALSRITQPSPVRRSDGAH